jgi:hypothetical protein
MDGEALQERFGEEKCLGIKVAGTKEERLLAMIEALGDRHLHAISIKRAHKMRPVELRIRPPSQIPARRPHLCLLLASLEDDRRH